MKMYVWGICVQQRSRSAFPSVQSDQGFHSLLIESLDTLEYTIAVDKRGCQINVFLNPFHAEKN